MKLFLRIFRYYLLILSIFGLILTISSVFIQEYELIILLSTCTLACLFMLWIIIEGELI